MSYEKIFAIRQGKKRQIWDWFSNKEDYPKDPTQFITIVVKKAQVLLEQDTETYRNHKQNSAHYFKNPQVKQFALEVEKTYFILLDTKTTFKEVIQKQKLQKVFETLSHRYETLGMNAWFLTL